MERKQARTELEREDSDEEESEEEDKNVKGDRSGCFARSSSSSGNGDGKAPTSIDASSEKHDQSAGSSKNSSHWSSLSDNGESSSSAKL